MRHQTSLDADYFEQMFQDTPDPWDFETSAYEQAKYAQTLAALGDRRFDRALEIGCANGVLTARLAPYCERLLAIDVSETALDLARARCSSLPQVTFERIEFPRQMPCRQRVRSAAALRGRLLLGRCRSAARRRLDCQRCDHRRRTAAGALDGRDRLSAIRRRRGAEADAMLAERIVLVQADRQPEYRLDLWRMGA